MKNLKTYIVISAIFIFAGQSFEAYSQLKFAVIANKSVPIEDFLKNDIRKVYYGFSTQWKNKEKVKPCYAPIPNDAFWFYIQTSESKFDAFWTKRVFSGNGVAPISYENDSKVIDYVNRTPGAIGIINDSEKGNIGANSKVLAFKL